MASIKFKAITVAKIIDKDDILYALGEDGRVYRYYSATDKRFAFWSVLTNHTPNVERNKYNEPQA